MSRSGAYIVETAEGATFHVLLVPENGAYRVEVETGDRSSSYLIESGVGTGRAWVGDRPLEYHWVALADDAGRLFVNGSDHDFTVRTAAAARIAAMNVGESTAAGAAEIRAPMPGLVLEVEVSEGDVVTTGDGLVIIEAMKMENEIRAPAGGVVRELSVRVGDPIEQGVTLCRIEPEAS